MLAGLVSASIGIAGLGAIGRIGVTDFAFTWWTWYVGDVIGILVFAPLTLALLEGRDPRWQDRWRHIFLPLPIILALGVMAFHGAGQWEVQERQARLGQVGEAIARDLDNRLHTHREVLSALRHLIEVKPDLSFAEFEQFTRATLADNPDLLALSFNPLVRAAEREAFEARMSQQVPTGHFQILERDTERRPVPAGMRPEYAPVTYIMPWEPNQAVLGFDNFSEPVRRAATERVSNHRRLAVAAPIDLVQETARRTGMLEMLPVEDHQATDAAGLPRLLGFVVGVVRIDQLITLATQGKIPAGLQLQLTETARPGAEEGVIYRPGDFPGPSGAIRHTGDQWRGHLRVGDRDWHLTLSATPAYLRQHRSWAAWGVGMVGLVFAALLQFMMLGFTGRAYLIELQNTALEVAEAKLRELNASLAHRVEERTTELRDLNLELNRLATTDSLTGAWNRRYFEQAAAFEIARTDRHGDPLSLLMLDIDHFKLLNDTHGHPVGDKVLVELTRRVRPRLRATDIWARWGGEEFVALLPDTNGEDAVRLAEKLRQLIAGEPFPGIGQVTSSFGVAEFRPDETADHWFTRVDKALYAAKKAGRNRVSLHQG